ncbi:MAG: [citrate (pro-3S)-lyase] ligase [Sarcina sp.]
MEAYDFQKEIFENPSSKNLIEVKAFLKKQGLDFDDTLQYTVVLKSFGQVVATGSFTDNILKCIAVDENYRGYGLSNIIISDLLSEEYRQGNMKLFVYTKPENEKLFEDFGFYTLERSPKVIILENSKNGMEKYCEALRKETVELDRSALNSKDVSAIVMNCNPFTNGHRYLIEQASKESTFVHLFIISEEKSIFPSDVRFKLVNEGVKDLKNVITHKAKDYIISSSTFPSYFLKEVSDVVNSQAIIDAKIFAKHIAKSLNISKRYVGSEPYCKLTNIYNIVLKNVLSENDIELIELERLKLDDGYISASKVRELLKYNSVDTVQKFVPKVTYDFLNSDEGKEIICKLKK